MRSPKISEKSQELGHIPEPSFKGTISIFDAKSKGKQSQSGRSKDIKSLLPRPKHLSTKSEAYSLDSAKLF